MSRTNKKAQKLGCLKLIKFVTWMICILSFCINVNHTIVSYFQYEKLKTVVERGVENGSLEFPSFAICNSRPFIDPFMDMVTMDDYEKNTIDPSKFVLNVMFHHKDCDEVRRLLFYNKPPS